MPRNAEVTRQWTILRELEATKYGKTLDELAEMCGKHPRTIRRDIQALDDVGFPLVEARDALGKVRWKLLGPPFQKIREVGLTFTEACALAYSRSLLQRMGGEPFGAELDAALKKIEAGLSARMRAFVDELPAVVAAKAQPRAGDGQAQRETVARLFDAVVRHRIVEMRYHSFSSRRVKEYRVHPYQLAWGMGALYLIAEVPAYGELRTFTVARIKKLAVMEDTFKPSKQVKQEVFGDSMGPFSGKPVPVALEFDPRVAQYVKERVWHPTQQVEDLPSGGARVRLRVCDDYSLRSWILGFGAMVRVVEPADLAVRILEEHEQARLAYAPRIEFDLGSAPFTDTTAQLRLPLRSRRTSRGAA
jgi:predicted DNA-binding transcriptional regulator YafY